jgi:hypothetical protein
LLYFLPSSLQQIEFKVNFVVDGIDSSTEQKTAVMNLVILDDSLIHWLKSKNFVQNKNFKSCLNFGCCIWQEELHLDVFELNFWMGGAVVNKQKNLAICLAKFAVPTLQILFKDVA